MNKTALVTGANRGIGKEIATQLAKAGMKVIVTARDQSKGEAAAKALAAHGDVVFHALDTSNSQSIHELAAFVTKNFDWLDVLVNNAGIIGAGAGITEASEQDLREVMDTNYFGPLLLTQALLPCLRKSPDARVINVSSGMGTWDELNGSSASYRLSKSGLNALTVMFARALQGTSVKVNAMCPGWVQSDMGGKSAPRTLQQGADTALWLATAASVPSGKIFRDRREISF